MVRPTPLRSEEDVDAQVLNAIKESYFFLIMLSPVSVSKNGYVRKEVKLAFDMIRGLGLYQSFIIPVRIAECAPRREEYRPLKEIARRTVYIGSSVPACL